MQLIGDDERRKRPFLVLAGLGVLTGVVAFVAACSSSTSFGSGSTGSFGGSASAPAGPPSAGFTPSAAQCPALRPTEGDFCSGGVCEYGGHADPRCNIVARCPGDRWTIDDPSHCPDACPARFDELRPGEACSGPDTCTYLEATCGCAGAIAAADGGDPGGDPGADAGTTEAGADAATPEGHWQCVRPGNACPARMPLAGAHCTKEMTCDYGTCVFGVPLTMECDGYVWLGPGSQQCP
jgi:hypothetical protein